MKEAEQCCALIADAPNPRRCIEPGFQGWHYCRHHLTETPSIVTTGMFVVEVDDQSPIRAALQ